MGEGEERARDAEGVRLSVGKIDVWELGGLYYQVLGYAWDHQVKDFKVLYRPLYDCHAKKGSFEAHELAVSHFERWYEKFSPVEDPSNLPLDVISFLRTSLNHSIAPSPLGGAKPAEVAAVTRSCSASGHGTRSFEVPKLETIIGDYQRFIDLLLEQLKAVLSVSSYEMDHVCYRCETEEEYSRVCGALCPAFGEVLIDALVGGRRISTIRLHSPIRHAGFSVSCLEVPCPKPNASKTYRSGLEHAEFVIGSPADGMHGNERLRAFMAENSNCQFDTRALSKECNADVSLDFRTEELGVISAKFHQRPLYEVAAYELKACSPPVSKAPRRE